MTPFLLFGYGHSGSNLLPEERTQHVAIIPKFLDDRGGPVWRYLFSAGIIHALGADSAPIPGTHEGGPYVPDRFGPHRAVGAGLVPALAVPGL